MTARSAIVGIGHTPLGKISGRSAWSLQAEAVIRAVKDAGLNKKDVDGLITEPGYAQGIVRGITPHYLRLGAMLGLDPDYTSSEVLGGASSVAMVQRAAMAVSAGLCRCCVCVFGDSPLSSPGTWGYGRGDDAAFGMFGAVGFYALAARRHMHLYGTTPGQLGEVAVTFRRHASLTPHAQERTPLTRDDYFRSPYVVEPLRRLDCCLVSDGAGAVVIASAERAQDLKQQPVFIRGFGQGHRLTTLSNPHHLTESGAARSGPIAFRMAGITAKDVDVLELYDCFTIVVLLQLEDYGFCPKGEGGWFVENGRLGVYGELPTNTAGGLLSEGFGGGMFHIIEAVRQLRGECGERQVKGAEVALVSGLGLGMNTHATLILSR